MNSKKKFVPTLYPLSLDLSKKWFVEYLGDDGRKKKLYGKMDSLDTFPERLSEADRLIASICVAPPRQRVEGNQLVHDLWEIFELRSEGLKPKSIATYKTLLETFVKWYRVNRFPEMNSLAALKFLHSVLEKNGNTTRNN